MSEYISSFITGFDEVIKRALPLLLKGVKIIAVYDGLIHYSYKGNPQFIKDIIFFNNSFRVIKKYRGSDLEFSKMVSRVEVQNKPRTQRMSTFRVRFLLENQFSKVDRQITALAEKKVCKETGMFVDRVNPQHEFWYIIRSENVGFYVELLRKRKTTEKTLNKGELRPEFAFLMCVFANIRNSDVICDPFAGYGAISQQLLENFTVNYLYVNDIDKTLVGRLKKLPQLQKDGVTILCEDALQLHSIKDNSIDIVITDPPWGYYEQIEDITFFYTKMIQNFRRILKPQGKAVVLSARKTELIVASQNEHIRIVKQIDTLVNGKKAAIFYIQF